MSELEKTIANFRFVVKMLEGIHKEFCWYRDHGENVLESKEKFLDFTDTVIELIDISAELEDEYLDKNKVDGE